jgi:hypothetical protein
MSNLARGFAILLLALALGVPARGADMDARTVAAVADLLSAVSPDRPPAGADPQAYGRAVEALRKAGLAGFARPAQPGDTALLEAYGRALLLGPRAKQFADRIGAVHDAVVSGQDEAIESAISALYVAAGRPAPKGQALIDLAAAANQAGGGAPQPTMNHSIAGEGYRIDIADAVAAGKTTIEVTLDEGAGGQPTRVLFEGSAQTRAKSDGDGLERRVVAAEPCVMTQERAAALRDLLNGEWTDNQGIAWTIAGAGDSILLTQHRAGIALAFEGTYRLGKIDARHAITHPDAMNETLPATVRQQLAGMGLFFTLRLETCHDIARLAGRWGSQHVTYDSMFMQVSKVHDPYDVAIALIGESSDYRIAGLEIDFKGWEEKQAQLRARVAVAQDDLRRAEEEVRSRTAEYDERREATGRAHRAFIAAEAAYDDATLRLNEYVPGDAGKSAAYRRLEQRRDRLTRRVNMLYDGIMANRGHVIAESAFEIYYELEAELAEVNRQLDRMNRELGFVAERERLIQVAQDAFVAKIRAETELEGAAAVQDGARARSDQAELRLSDALAKLSAAEQEMARFDAGAFRIEGAEAEEGPAMRYKVEAWDPSEVLAFQDREIAELAAVLARASATRRAARAEFLAAQDIASNAQLRLADGIMKSAYAQGLTELAFNTLDVVEKTVEAGPVGALGEGAKKVIEAAILGPPSFYEPSLVPEIMTGDGGPFSDIRGNLTDALKYSAKRGFKSAVSGPAASLVINKYLLARDTRVYMELIGQAVEGSMQTGYRIVGRTQAQAAATAFAALEKAQAGMKKAVDQGLFRNFAGLTRLSFKDAFRKIATSPQAGKLAHSVGRDLAKMATKKALAEWIEGEALALYLAAEAEARLRTQIFLAASSVYWEAYDEHRKRVDERREILRQYDARNHMRILKDERFPEGAELLIVLRDAAGRPLSAAGHRVTVTLGGKQAEQVAADQMFFRIAANDLEHDGDGGVTLAIAVAE